MWIEPWSDAERAYLKAGNASGRVFVRMPKFSFLSFFFSGARPIVWGDRRLRVTLLETSARTFSTLADFKKFTVKRKEEKVT